MSITTNGRYLSSTVAAALKAATGASTVFTDANGYTSDGAGIGKFLVQAGSLREGDRKRGCSLQFVVNADGKTATAKLWRVTWCGSERYEMDLALWDTLTLTGSTLAGVGTAAKVLTGDSCVLTTEVLCDTITNSASALAGKVATAFAAPDTAVIYSPAGVIDNIPATVWVPDLGNSDLLVELYGSGGGTAASAVNCIVEAGY